MATWAGGEESGVYRTKDGGDSWEELNNGLPDGPLGRIFLQAGSRAYCADKGRLAAYALPAKKNDKPAWSASVEGRVWTMLAADQKLFVVTTDSVLHCFGTGTAAPIRRGVGTAPRCTTATRHTR